VRAIADHVYRFLQANFRDRDGEYFFKVDADGAPLDRRKVLYAEAFAIYSLTSYGRVFHVPTAISDALTCFRSLDARAHDAAHGGYEQRADAPWLTPGAAKETNTHLHLLEAFTALFEATGDAGVRVRVEELVHLFVERIVQPAGYAAKDFTTDFTPFGTPTQSYGHDLETAWLLLESARVLGRPSDPGVLDASRRLATTATAQGYDREHGGFFEEGPAGAHATKTEKIWWVQVEALLGLWALYGLSRSDEVLSDLEGTLDFIERYQRDARFGGWYWGLTPTGEIGPHGTNKGEEWKASYHELRALVLTEDWIRAGTGPLVAP
jgi:mannobiose 2-epimerase